VDRVSGNGMFPDQPAPAQLIQVAAQGPRGGPTYSYREARIECCPGAHVCGLFMPGHPLSGLSVWWGPSRRWWICEPTLAGRRATCERSLRRASAAATKGRRSATMEQVLILQ
jgi:hypothetical protein